MSPPIVYEETRPRSQRTIKMTAIVSSICSSSKVKWRRERSHYTQ